MSARNEVRADVLAGFQSCRLWRAASPEAVTRLAAGARVVDVARGTTLATEGDPALEFGLVVAGKARAFYLGADGRQITFETMQAGDPLAAVVALAGTRYPVNIEAATDATIAFLPTSALFDLLEEEPQVARSLIADLANRVVNFTSVVHTLALDVPSRLAGYLFQRALRSGRPTPAGLEIEVGMKKGDLALSLGTVPETLSRAFAKLKDDGLLEMRGSTVTILDVRALASLGSGYAED